MKANSNIDIIETALLRGKVKLLQPKVGFHASLDTVFLAAATVVKDRWHVLDIGCGVGSAGLCVTLKNKNISLIGIDIQKELIDLACQNAYLNNMTDRAQFFCTDISKDKLIENNQFHSVLINPPYQESGSYTPSPQKIKAFANGEDASGVTLKEWVKYAHSKLKQGGYITVIHRADRIDDLLSSLTARRWFGGVIIYPLFSRKGDDAKRVIVQARKERYAPAVIKAGMVIHEKDGSYTKEAEAVLSHGASIEL